MTDATTTTTTAPITVRDLQMVTLPQAARIIGCNPKVLAYRRERGLPPTPYAVGSSDVYHVWRYKLSEVEELRGKLQSPRRGRPHKPPQG